MRDHLSYRTAVAKIFRSYVSRVRGERDDVVDRLLATATDWSLSMVMV